MSVIFLKLLNLSISASWLVLVVLVLRLVLKRAPKWVDVLLWGMVALRLMLPFSIESALSLIPSAETLSPEVVQFDPAPTITSGVELIDNAVNPSLSESFAAAPLASVNLLYVWTYLAGWVWLIGLAAMLLYALVSYLRLRRRVSASIPLRENIYVCDEVASPFILGILRPRIYLPSALDEAQRGSVLSHERAHLARRDHWWKPLGFALLAVYWFNPLLWLAYTLLCRDIELACDERVLCGMDAGQVKDYSSALLACSVPRRMLAACPLAFGEVGVGAREERAALQKARVLGGRGVGRRVRRCGGVLSDESAHRHRRRRTGRFPSGTGHLCRCNGRKRRAAIQRPVDGGGNRRRLCSARHPAIQTPWCRVSNAGLLCKALFYQRRGRTLRDHAL